MKIIKPGTPGILPWWVGKIGTCTACGQQEQFEQGDDRRTEWTNFLPPGQAGLFCTCCGSYDTIIVKRE